VLFANYFRLDHSSALMLPGGQTIDAKPGDTAIFRAEGSTWRCIAYMRASGPGTLLQSLSSETSAVATGTTVIPDDDTIPQSNEGDKYMSVSIEPKNPSGTLNIDVVFNFSNSTPSPCVVALFQDDAPDALAAASNANARPDVLGQIEFTHRMTCESEYTTFKLRAGPTTAGTLTFNGIAGARRFGGTVISTLVVNEIETNF
jgi:hypothetical protein